MSTAAAVNAASAPGDAENFGDGFRFYHSVCACWYSRRLGFCHLTLRSAQQCTGAAVTAAAERRYSASSISASFSNSCSASSELAGIAGSASGYYRHLRSSYLTGWTCRQLAGSFVVLAPSSGIYEPALGSRLPAFESMNLKFERMSRICYTLCSGAANVSESMDALCCHCAALFGSSYFGQVSSFEVFHHSKSSQSTRHEAV